MRSSISEGIAYPLAKRDNNNNNDSVSLALSLSLCLSPPPLSLSPPPPLFHRVKCYKVKFKIRLRTMTPRLPTTFTFVFEKLCLEPKNRIWEHHFTSCAIFGHTLFVCFLESDMVSPKHRNPRFVCVCVCVILAVLISFESLCTNVVSRPKTLS